MPIRRGSRTVFVYGGLVFLSALFFAPFVWLAMTSFKPENETFK
ncbi:MAG: carbohydrate ABC transporter permease, partial [Armatimonadetes bacterium]|nr:carbohydrate ABC transporter permease [Armatimonadota bacterium]